MKMNRKGKYFLATEISIFSFYFSTFGSFLFFPRSVLSLSPYFGNVGCWDSFVQAMHICIYGYFIVVALRQSWGPVNLQTSQRIASHIRGIGLMRWYFNLSLPPFFSICSFFLHSMLMLQVHFYDAIMCYLCPWPFIRRFLFQFIFTIWHNMYNRWFWFWSSELMSKVKWFATKLWISMNIFSPLCMCNVHIEYNLNIH